MTLLTIPSLNTFAKTTCLQIILENNVDIVGLQEIAVTDIEEWFNSQLAAAGYGYYKMRYL